MDVRGCRRHVLPGGGDLEAGALDFLRPPSIPEQFDVIRREAATSNDMIQVVLEEAELHGEGQTTYFMILRPSGYLRFEDPFSEDLGSDEIRVYDVVGSRLELRLRFRPDLLPPTGPDGELYGGSPLLWGDTRVVDANGDGFQEVVGSLSGFGMGPVFPTPVVVGWDPAQSGYSLRPLFSSKPSLTKLARRGLYASHIQAVFRNPYTVRNLHGGQTFKAFPTSGFAIRLARDPRPFWVIVGYLARADSHAEEETGLFEVVLYDIATLWPQPRAFECHPLLAERFLRSPQEETLIESLVLYGRTGSPGCF